MTPPIHHYRIPWAPVFTRQWAHAAPPRPVESLVRHERVLPWRAVGTVLPTTLALTGCSSADVWITGVCLFAGLSFAVVWPVARRFDRLAEKSGEITRLLGQLPPPGETQHDEVRRLIEMRLGEVDTITDRIIGAWSFNLVWPLMEMRGARHPDVIRTEMRTVVRGLMDYVPSRDLSS